MRVDIAENTIKVIDQTRKETLERCVEAMRSRCHKCGGTGAKLGRDYLPTNEPCTQCGKTETLMRAVVEEPTGD